MEEIRTVTGKGQVTIPEAIRSELGIESGDRVIFRCEGNGSMIVKKDTTPRKATAGLLDKHLKKGSKSVSIETMKKAIAGGASRGFRP